MPYISGMTVLLSSTVKVTLSSIVKMECSKTIFDGTVSALLSSSTIDCVNVTDERISLVLSIASIISY